jgi:hypothetical protein
VSDALRTMVASHVLSKSASGRGDYRIDDALFAEWLMQERERLPSRQRMRQEPKGAPPRRLFRSRQPADLPSRVDALPYQVAAGESVWASAHREREEQWKEF